MNMTDPVIIKKYGNRRLYDTEKSGYITLNQLADTIRKGHTVKVLDAKTREDVTAFILTQVILEEAKNKNTLLPEPLLYMAIRFGDNLLVEFFEKYLYQIIQTYLAHKTAFDEQFKAWIGMGMNLSDMTRQTMADLTPLKSFLDLSSMFATDPPKKKAHD